MLSIIGSLMESEFDKYCIYFLDSLVALSILCMMVIAITQVNMGII
ncbi:MAG: hypothetical protein V4732_03620 [Pseudomonadota bacterium]